MKGREAKEGVEAPDLFFRTFCLRACKCSGGNLDSAWLQTSEEDDVIPQPVCVCVCGCKKQNQATEMT